MPDNNQQQIVKDFWRNTCQCTTSSCVCGRRNAGELLRGNVVSMSGMQRCHLLRLQQSYWLSGSVIDEFIRLLNMRQQEVERTGVARLRVLYLDTVFSSYVHPAAHNAVESTAADADNVQKVLAPALLSRTTGCSRCCLDQDRIIFVVGINHNHWVCIVLEVTICCIMYLDSLNQSPTAVSLAVVHLPWMLM